MIPNGKKGKSEFQAIRACLLEQSRVMIPGLNARLVWYTPEQVWNSIYKFPVRQWHHFMEAEYEPRDIKKLCLLVQCAGPKPYPRAFSIKQVLNTIQDFVYDIDIIVVSEPFALEPEDYWSLQWKYNGRNVNLLYDCPGLMKWWVTAQFGTWAWNEELYEKTADKIGLVIRAFFERVEYDEVILYAVTGTHRDFVSRAEIDATILPRKIDRLHTRLSFGKNLSSLRRTVSRKIT